MKTTRILKVFMALAFLINQFYGFSQTEVYSYNYDSEHKKKVIVWNFDSDDHSSKHNFNYSLNYSGNIEVSENDKDIIKISKNGYFKVSKVVFGNNRRIEISSDENGKLSKKYYEGKTEGNFDTEGKRWLADILPDIVRRTGVGAEHRVAAIFKHSGIKGLLDEIEEIDDYSGSVRNLYFVIMVDQLKLSEQDLSLAIASMEMINSNSTKGSLMREILYKYDLSVINTIVLLETTSTLHYNTERGSVLRVLNTKLNQDPRIMEAYFDIIEDMSINSEKGNVLKHLMQQNKLEASSFMRLFESLDDFSSNREKGAILIAAIQYLPMDEKVIQMFFEAVEDISSDYYVLKGEIISSLVDKQTGSPTITKGNKTILLQLLETAKEYNSNSQKALTLRKVNRMIIDDNVVYEEYKYCLNSISAELERYNILLDLLEKQKLSKNGYLMLFDAAELLVKDDYQHAVGAILRNAIKEMPNDDKLLYAYFDIINKMDQNGTIEEILRYINTDTKFAGNEVVVIKSIEAVNKIDVSIEKSTVLNLLKPHVKTREQKLAYSYAIKDIDSDYLKRKVTN